MMLRWSVFLLPLFLLLAAFPADAALIDQVNQAFRAVHGRTPTSAEWNYWASRVQRGEKTTYAALVGAIGYQNVNSPGTVPTRTVPSVDFAGGFAIGKQFYPSSHNPNAHPNGTLVRSAATGSVYYMRDGKRSWIIPDVLNRWLNENHFYKHDIVITLADANLAKFPQTSSVNPIYIGKVLVHPNGTEFFIDDKFRKRQLPGSVRSALKIPAGNKYPTSIAHLNEFKSGPALKADAYAGGMVVYTGAYHGGRIWKFAEITGGAIVKRLYLSDYIYEADGNPDESHRAPAVPAIFDKHGRGSNIEKYPDGWVVGLSSNIYIVQNEKLRLIGSPQLFDALGYTHKYVLKHHPEFLRRYAHGDPVRAFRNLAPNGISADRGLAQAAPNTASALTKVRPEIRALINQVNDLYIAAYGKDVTPSENKFWVDYLYNGEVKTKADLVAAMRRAATTGQKPARTSRTATLSEEKLESHWFPYLFYFVHQQEPSEADRNYWFSRIKPGDRDSIEELGGTIQWVKDNLGTTRR